MERVPVEVWQQILRKVMETNDSPIFATSCTPYTSLGFMAEQTCRYALQTPYLDYLDQRRCLQLVCRTWNELVLCTSHRWLLLEGWDPIYELDSTTTSRSKGGVGPVEKLSMKIHSDELVTPILSWASHILKRPASRSPLRACILLLNGAPVTGYNLFDDLLVGTTTTQDPEYTNTTLHSLSIATTRHVDISTSLSQISRTFTGLRSLFLINLSAMPQQTLRLAPLKLAHLEVLYVCCPELETLEQSMEAWDTPALRHVRLGDLRRQLTGVLDRFLGRYAHQIESLILNERVNFKPVLHLPSGFWAQFPALRLLGLNYNTLSCKGWSGWSIVPPPTHPCRYLICPGYSYSSVRLVIDGIRSKWTWHDGVRLLVEGSGSSYCFVESNHGPLIKWNGGVLPEL
jgi:hypothetical protein